MYVLSAPGSCSRLACCVVELRLLPRQFRAVVFELFHRPDFACVRGSWSRLPCCVADCLCSRTMSELLSSKLATLNTERHETDLILVSKPVSVWEVRFPMDDSCSRIVPKQCCGRLMLPRHVRAVVFQFLFTALISLPALPKLHHA